MPKGKRSVRARDDPEWSAWLNKHNAEVCDSHPELIPLKKKLLGINGDFVVLYPDEDATKIVKKGELFKGYKPKLKRMNPIQCHSNVAELWSRPEYGKRKCEIATGYGLTGDDGLWRSHSWLVCEDKKELVETTVPRKKYFGVRLNKTEAQQFLEDNW